jgi:ATP-binding cassette subfamily B protein
MPAAVHGPSGSTPTLMAMAQKDNDRPAAKSPRSLSGLRPFLRPYRLQITLAGLFLVLAAVSTLAFPVALKSLIDQGVSPPTRASG